MSNPSSQAANSLAARIAVMVACGEMRSTRARGLTVYKVCTPARRTFVVYRPSLCVVAQGGKIAHVGRSAYSYDPSQYFFSALPLPAELEVPTADARRPVLGLVLELDAEAMGRMCLDVAERSKAPMSNAQGQHDVVFTSQMSGELADALTRLLAAADDELRYQVLYESTLREIIYFLVTGPNGPAIRDVVLQRDRTRSIVESARYIDLHSDEPLSVPALARMAGMSESSYFQGFREVTGFSPLQYLKRIRLVKARTAIVGGTPVTQAALDVGYASPSQFSREFGGLFGYPPSRAAAVAAGASPATAVG